MNYALFSFTAGTFLTLMIGYSLMAGSSLLIPLVIAIFIWHFLNSVHHGLRHIPGCQMIPYSITLLITFCIVILFGNAVVQIISTNVTAVIDNAPRYQDHLVHMFNKMDDRFNLRHFIHMENILKGINIQSMLVNIYNVFSAVASSAVLIGLYVAFLFIEQLFFQQKLDALFSNPQHRALLDTIISRIAKDTQTYLALKTFTGLLAAIPCWMIMRWVGLDFAEFWALLIFFLSYIPNIGAIIATMFPVLLAVVQFQDPVPCTILTVGIVSIQFVVGNILEPKFFGQSLNVSPLVILLSLALWGTIWGILGMFLSVPITVMLIIVFSHFKTTKPFAILLSRDGNL
ncbi:MAG: AI-2E family transporter [Legionellaceae bacterium]|nr:AI-2E family transporter [Legionellaceae bacterium]